MVLLLPWKPHRWHSTHIEICKRNQSTIKCRRILWKLIHNGPVVMNLCQPVLGVQFFKTQCIYMDICTQKNEMLHNTVITMTCVLNHTLYSDVITLVRTACITSHNTYRHMQIHLYTPGTHTDRHTKSNPINLLKDKGVNWLHLDGIEHFWM